MAPQAEVSVYSDDEEDFDSRRLRLFLQRCDLRVIAPLVLYGPSSVLNGMPDLWQRIGVSWGNSLGLLARRDEVVQNGM